MSTKRADFAPKTNIHVCRSVQIVSHDHALRDSEDVGLLPAEWALRDDKVMCPVMESYGTRNQVYHDSLYSYGRPSKALHSTV